MDDPDSLSAFRSQWVASLRRLQAAGIVGAFEVGAEPGDGWIRWTEPYFHLLQAGRHPMEEAGMVAAWATGDPATVRRWVEREARALGWQPS